MTGSTCQLTRISESFGRQSLMATLGARLASVEPGVVIIEMPTRADLCQQHGFIHAGVVTTLVDTACGYAALTQMPENAEVLTVEFKANFLSPAMGDLLIATGRIVKSGRTLTFCAGEVHAQTLDKRNLIATLQATMIARLPG